MKLKQNKTKGKNANGFLSAIISGILTEIVADELLKPSYIVTENKEGLSVNSVSSLAVWQVLLILLGAFVSLWLLINYGIPYIVRQIKKLRYQKTKTYSLEEIVNGFREYEVLVNTIYSDYLKTHDIELSKINSIALFQSLAEIDNEISSIGYENIAAPIFRKSNELCTLKQHLSRYEVLSSISRSELLIKDMELMPGNDPNVANELKGDCAKAKEIIDHLKDLVK